MVTSSLAIQTRHKVLLVDDDAVSLELMALLLAHEGHQVIRAEDAASALEVLSADSSPDVLLVDLQMPGISGEEFAIKVRALGNMARRPLLLAMSASAATDQQLSSFDGFLLKPLALKDLRRALEPPKQGRGSGLRVVHSRKPSPARPAAASAEGAALDMTVVDKLLAMMPREALQNVFLACLADTRASIARLDEYVLAGNQKVIRETAHRIKGGAQMIGATRIAGLAARLEAGVDEEAATRSVLNELLSASAELEGMLLAGKFTIRAPHHEPSKCNTGNT